MSSSNELARLVQENEAELLASWLTELTASLGRGGASREAEFREDCAEFLRLLAQAARSASLEDPAAAAFDGLRQHLSRFTLARLAQGFSPSETASFVFSLRKPLLSKIADARSADSASFVAHLLVADKFIDRLGLHTMEVYQKGREDVIARQQRDMLELSTPVVKLWDGILALPMIGTLDSERTQIVMESLLQRILETASEVAIIDITGVPTVDTLVAQHLLKTVAAARLMGVECIISGIRPQIAQTIVHLGVELGSVITKANLADAFGIALSRRGMAITRVAAGA